MELYVVRHGQTNGNIEKVLDGCKRDIPLNDTGLMQANSAKDTLKDVKFDIIICSPLIRTKQTMDIINVNNIPVIYESKVIERDCGEFTGKSYDSIDWDLYWNYNDETQYLEAEKIKDFFKRIYDYLDYIKELYSDKTVLMVTHGGVSKAINCYFNGIPADGDLQDVGLGNCEIAKYTI